MLWEHVAGGSNPSTPTKKKGLIMDNVLKCPVTGNISLEENCIRCDRLFQYKESGVECYIDGKNCVTPSYKPDDPKVEEL